MSQFWLHVYIRHLVVDFIQNNFKKDLGTRQDAYDFYWQKFEFIGHGIMPSVVYKLLKIHKGIMIVKVGLICSLEGLVI